jgi:HK97 family phage major capsid protein
MMDLETLSKTFEGYHGEVKSIAATVADLSGRLEQIETRAARPGAGATGAKGDAVAEYKALSVFARTGEDRELKAMSIGSDADGGYIVSPAISATMTKKLFDFSPLRRLARVETITTGDAWEEPIDNDEVGATWVGESQSRPATDTPTLGLLRVPVHEIYALQSVTQRLLDDATSNVGAWIENKISDKFARSEGTAFVSGDGVNRPKGLLSYSTSSSADSSRSWGTLQFVNSGGASSITADGLRDLMWAVRAPYRQGSSWLMSSATANSVDKLKDSAGDYLWRDGMTAGAPPSLLGYPVEFSEDMPAIAASAFPIAFGNFREGYVIVEKAGIRFLRDPFSSKPSVLFYAYRRVGGGVANSEAVKLLKIAA